MINLKQSVYKSYDELPLFLNAVLIAKVLGIADSSAYELMHSKDFPVVKIVRTILAIPATKLLQEP